MEETKTFWVIEDSSTGLFSKNARSSWTLFLRNAWVVKINNAYFFEKEITAKNRIDKLRKESTSLNKSGRNTFVDPCNLKIRKIILTF